MDTAPAVAQAATVSRAQFHSGRPLKRRRRILLLGLIALGLLVAVSRFFDFPAFRDEPQPWLKSRIPTKSTQFYSYRLSGYLDVDEEYLCRLDGSKAIVEQLLEELELSPIERVPNEFWRIRPYYWPKRRFEGSRSYQTQHFAPDCRGMDGLHAFAVHDPNRDRLYLWVKDNF